MYEKQWMAGNQPARVNVHRWQPEMPLEWVLFIVDQHCLVLLLLWWLFTVYFVVAARFFLLSEQLDGLWASAATVSNVEGDR